MNACRAHFTPVDDHLPPPSARAPTTPPSATNPTSRPWRPPPYSCEIASILAIGPSYLVDTSQTSNSSAKSPAAFDHRQHPHPVYPSPPLTDAALASTVPLPDVPGESLPQHFYASDREGIVNENMSHNGARHFAPLSPPPTVLVNTKALPGEYVCQDGEHQVESWGYEDTCPDAVAAPLFPPVRDDSGYEEFSPRGGCPDHLHLHRPHGVGRLIEPTSSWIPHSPLSIDEGLPLIDIPSIHDILSSSCVGDRSSGHADALISPVSPSEADSHSDTWASGSDMDWQYSPSSTFADDLSAPPSPKPGCLSLSFADIDTPLGFQPHPFSQSHSLSPLELPYDERDAPWSRGYGESSGQPYLSTHHTSLADKHAPFLSFHSLPLHPPPADLDSEYPDTLMPPEDNDDRALSPPPSPRRRINDLDDVPAPHGDVRLTPVPRSPHGPLLALPDLDMEDLTEPSSPHSPHRALPLLGSDEDDAMSFSADPPIETISPSLLGGTPNPQPEPQVGLGLFLPPMSDPPLARSPSPDDDDLGFLDVQLDPESTHLEIDEFLYLRALRKNALALERAARLAEADLSDRITDVATALLPTSHSHSQSQSPSPSPSVNADEDDDADVRMQETETDPAEKRTRKRELQTLMDMRAEARRSRKVQKQRSKEIGALLDLKMQMHSSSARGHGQQPMSPPMESLSPLAFGSGAGWTRSMGHLVAHMVLRRRDRSRPLENRPQMPGVGTPVRRASPLSARGGVEEADEDMDSVVPDAHSDGRDRVGFAGADEEDGDEEEGEDDDMEM